MPPPNLQPRVMGKGVIHVRSVWLASTYGYDCRVRLLGTYDDNIIIRLLAHYLKPEQ